LLRFAQHIAGRSPDKPPSLRWQGFAEEILALRLIVRTGKAAQSTSTSWPTRPAPAGCGWCRPSCGSLYCRLF